MNLNPKPMVNRPEGDAELPDEGLPEDIPEDYFGPGNVCVTAFDLLRIRTEDLENGS